VDLLLEAYRFRCLPTLAARTIRSRRRSPENNEILTLHRGRLGSPLPVDAEPTLMGAPRSTIASDNFDDFLFPDTEPLTTFPEGFVLANNTESFLQLQRDLISLYGARYALSDPALPFAPPDTAGCDLTLRVKPKDSPISPSLPSNASPLLGRQQTVFSDFSPIVRAASYDLTDDRHSEPSAARSFSFSPTREHPTSNLLRVHRAILSARCPYFQTMFESGMQDAQADVIPVREHNRDTVESVLHYIYCSNVVRVTPDNLVNIFLLADQYLLEQLKKQTRRFVTRLEVHDLLWVTFLSRGRSTELYESCIEVLGRCGSHLFNEHTFPMLPEEIVRDLLQAELLGVASVEVFQALCQWGKARVAMLLAPLNCDVYTVLPYLSTAENARRLAAAVFQLVQASFQGRPASAGPLTVKGVLQSLMPLVKFSRMTPSELRDVVIPSQLVDPALLRDLLNDNRQSESANVPTSDAASSAPNARARPNPITRWFGFRQY